MGLARNGIKDERSIWLAFRLSGLNLSRSCKLIMSDGAHVGDQVGRSFVCADSPFDSQRKVLSGVFPVWELGLVSSYLHA